MKKLAIEPRHFPYLDYKRYTFSLGLQYGDNIWLSGHSASHFDTNLNRVTAEGSMVEQARLAYQKIGDILKAAKSGFHNLVRIVEYITPSGIAGYQSVESLRNEIFGKNRPAISPVVVKSLLRPEALIEIEAFATPKAWEIVDTGGSAHPYLQSYAVRAGNTLYIPAQLPVKPDSDKIIGYGNVVAQAQQIYENTDRILRAAGLGWEAVVKTLEFVTPGAMAVYKETAKVRRDYLGKAYPASTSIIMPAILHSEAMLQVEFIAVDAKRESINPGWKHYDYLTFIPGVRAGKYIFLTGQGSSDPVSHTLQYPDDIVNQTRCAYSNIRTVLEKAGGTMDSMVQSVEFITSAALKQYN